jgi:hypothetical protein
MPKSSIPVPRNGEKPSSKESGRSRPWPRGKRFILPTLTAAFVLAPVSYASACVDLDDPLPEKTFVCDRSDGKDWTSCLERPCDVPTEAPSESASPAAMPTDPASPTPTVLPGAGNDCDDGTCVVEADNPGFAG